MAYQLGVIQYRGKLGATVGRKKSAGQRANTIAARPQVISNPRSNAQAAQRMKLAPAVNFYRALRGILNHSWQGVSYGGASHSKFMKEAMRNQSYPYLMKGVTAPVPGEYKISSGSLTPVDVTLNNEAGSLLVMTSLRCSELLAGKTIKDISEVLVAENPQLLIGDQLTFVAAVADEVPGIEDGYISYRYFRFILSDTDTSVPEDDLIDETPIIKVNGGYIHSDSINLGFAISENTDMVAVGAAVIVSRPSVVKNNVTWERSNTTFKVTEPVSEYFSRNYDAVLASYKNNAANVSSDWYLNGGSTSGSVSPSQGKATLTISIPGFQQFVNVTGAGTYNIGDSVTVSTELKDDVANPQNYKFMGWYKNGEQVSANTNYQFTLEDNTALTCTWSLEEQP